MWSLDEGKGYLNVKIEEMSCTIKHLILADTNIYFLSLISNMILICDPGPEKKVIRVIKVN